MATQPACDGLVLPCVGLQPRCSYVCVPSVVSMPVALGRRVRCVLGFQPCGDGLHPLVTPSNLECLQLQVTNLLAMTTHLLVMATYLCWLVMASNLDVMASSLLCLPWRLR